MTQVREIISRSLLHRPSIPPRYVLYISPRITRAVAAAAVVGGGVCVWCNYNGSVEFTYPSYMMARKLNKRGAAGKRQRKNPQQLSDLSIAHMCSRCKHRRSQRQQQS